MPEKPMGEMQRVIETGRLAAHLFNLQLSLHNKQQLLAQLEQVKREVAQQLVPQDMAIAQSILEAKDQLCKLFDDGMTQEQVLAGLGGSQAAFDAVEMVRNASFKDITEKMNAGFHVAAGVRKE